ncbi:uncharacterized protein PHALS_08872 [Plasmopara halstedii]|uniref:Uncharacterized protein n=1 Tax=Plasmopara halstedii TaxID=4781 RepID=A0A0P1ADE7_PLAHL|nr:uncharacterized protein PHALS_08872 [Plasmopara halstedii]CEG38821.1 hypothetical protein PHALS_08872 [Plasmopara halstedii]|eukprot:XP_024575190.1 hypothetical protein PHALS_08872 [Plasmopara halstedii]
MSICVLDQVFEHLDETYIIILLDELFANTTKPVFGAMEIQRELRAVRAEIARSEACVRMELKNVQHLVKQKGHRQ